MRRLIGFLWLIAVVLGFSAAQASSEKVHTARIVILSTNLAEEGIGERDDAFDDHVVHGPKIHDEVGLLWNKSVLAHETYQAARQVTSFEFIPG